MNSFNIIQDLIHDISQHHGKNVLHKKLKEIPLFNDLTNQFPTDWSLNRKLFHLKNNILESPKCRTCKNEVRFGSLNEGYRTFCSSKCSLKDPLVIEKANSSRLENFNSKEDLIIHMQNLSKIGNDKLKELHKDEVWLEQKCKKFQQR